MPTGELVQIPGGRQKWYRPRYTTPKGNQYYVNEAAVSECPVSLLRSHADLRNAVDLITMDRCVNKGTGAMMFGADSGRWDAAWFDMIAVYNNYINLETAAGNEAIHGE